jgi:hypothetical protein
MLAYGILTYFPFLRKKEETCDINMPCVCARVRVISAFQQIGQFFAEFGRNGTPLDAP